MLFFSFIVATFVAVSSASQATHVHMRNMELHPKVQKIREAEPTEVHEVFISLKQNNLDKVESMLHERSDPKSSLFQNWLSYEEVGELVRNDEALATVTSWLDANGASLTWTARRKEFLRASAPVSTWENLLQAKFFEWEDSQYDTHTSKYLRSESYSMPVELIDHIDHIFGTVQIPMKIKKHGIFRTAEEVMKSSSSASNLRSDHFSVNQDVPASCQRYENNQCIQSPAFLKDFYGIPSSQVGTASLSQAAFSTDAPSEQKFSSTDLSSFQTKYGLSQQAAIAHASTSNSNSCTSDNCGEGNLDIQYIMAMSQKTVSYFWYEPDGPTLPDCFVNFLVNTQADDPTIKVVSISYGSNENVAYATEYSQFNTEAKKAALAGMSIFVSSGDDGVNGNDCDTSKYYASYPATSPYVTAVGATQNPESGSTPAEVVCSGPNGGGITSGGGFSAYFTSAKVDLSFQSSNVASYLASSAGKSAKTGYASGRGYPDVSAMGSLYPVYVGGKLGYFSGTSASSPMFAGIISLVNAVRFNQGLKSVGWINPALYASSTSLWNDITSGNNNCCTSQTCTSTTNPNGFTAATGWDPATGLGSIQFENLISILTNNYTVPTDAPTKSKSSSCFSRSDTVQLESGETKSFEKVQIGDKILVASMDGKVSGFSPVVALPHPVNSQLAEFIRIETASGRDVRMTRDHLVMGGICGSLSLVSAESLKTGNCVKTVLGEEVVSVVSVEKSRGVYSAVTMAGGLIVVNGVIASPFAVNHVVADSFYAVHRLIFKMFPFYLTPTGVLMKAINVFGDLVTA